MQAFNFPHCGDREAIKAVLSEFLVVNGRHVELGFDPDVNDASCFYLVLRVSAHVDVNMLSEKRFCELFGLEEHHVISVSASNDAAGVYH
jgi:hypothetical protein